jgi:hypothetical protein
MTGYYHFSQLFKCCVESNENLISFHSSSLFGNIQEIFRFQQQFLRTLEEAIEGETQFNVLDSAKQFKVSFC